MFAKSKSKSHSLAELHFVSSLQLEESVRLIGNIADRNHQVTITEVNPDEFKFHIDYLPEKSRVAEIKGTIQRWSGTETKLDANGDIRRIEQHINPNSRNLVFTLILFGIFGCWGGIGLGIGMHWIISIIVILLIASSFWLRELVKPSINSEDHTVLFRHRDYLFQRLIGAFKSAGEVESV